MSFWPIMDMSVLNLYPSYGQNHHIFVLIYIFIVSREAGHLFTCVGIRTCLSMKYLYIKYLLLAYLIFLIDL